MSADNSSKSPVISIITACLNSEATIQRSFESLLNQDYRDFEYIVVDGGSTDRTIEIIKRFSGYFIDRGIPFRYISEVDDGIYSAMNKGISLCRGDLIGILNSDDFYEPHALRVVSETFVSWPSAGIFYGYLRQFRGDNELVVQRFNYDYILSNLESGVYSAAQHPACFIRRSVYEKIGTYDLSFPIGADYDFLLRARSLGVEFAAIDAVIINFSLGGASSKITEGDRLEQRYRAQFRNGLLTEAEYKKKKKELKGNKYKALLKPLVKCIFRSGNNIQ